MTPTPSRGQGHDLLVVGAGPAGSAAAYWAATSGLDVVAVERKRFPRDKTCGDGLTPRAVHQLREMGLGDRVAKGHRIDGLRAVAHGRALELRWPADHPVYPDHGFVVRRRELDTFVAENAAEAGAEVIGGTEALAPIVEEGRVVGASVRDTSTGDERDVRARYVIVADGANSRFGRALGTSRNREMPQGIAIRTYFESPLHAEPWIESALDVRDRNGNTLPGYGWIFPLGDGTVNVGVGLLSTFKDYKDVNTSHLMSEFAATLPSYWEIDPDSPVQPPTGGRLPMGGSVWPRAGRNWMVVGDAAGSVNPFNGEGIDYAYETGRLAAALVAECVSVGSDAPVERYPELLDAEYGAYFKVARVFARVIGRPRLMSELTRVGMRSATLMDWVLRIMANLMRDDRIGPAEAVYKAAERVARHLPEKTAA